MGLPFSIISLAAADRIGQSDGRYCDKRLGPARFAATAKDKRDKGADLRGNGTSAGFNSRFKSK